MFTRIGQFLIWLLLASVSIGSAVAQECVSNWGDPELISIEGAKTFTADAIRAGLKANINVIVAAHPRSPLDKYLDELRNRVTQGYRRAGFPQATVTVERQEWRPRKLTIQIEEGPRFRAGGITVKGDAAINPVAVVDWLTSKQPPAGAVPNGFARTTDEHRTNWVDRHGNAAQLQPPTWKDGEYAKFDEATLKKLKYEVARALADLGHPWADFEISLSTDAEQRVANLQVDITSAGAAARVSQVTVHGNERDSTEDVLRYLQVPTGSTLSETERAKIWYKLWMSGRYLKHDVELIPPQQPGDGAELQIKLKEYAKATPLAKPLSPEEDSLLKCREWLLSASERGDDWVVKFSESAEGSVVVSPKYGTLVYGEPKLGTGKPFKFAIAATPVGLCYANSLAPGKLAVPMSQSQLVGSILLTSNNGDDPDHHFNMQFGLGASGAKKGGELPPFDLSLSISPVAILGMAHEGDPKFTWTGDVLTIEAAKDDSKTLTEFNTKTGQLIRQCFLPCEERKTSVQVTLENGAFEREFAAANALVENRLTEGESAFAAQRPLSSIVERLLGDDPLKFALAAYFDGEPALEQIEKLERVLASLVKAEALSPLDAFFVASKDDAESPEEFSIPDEFELQGDWWTNFVLIAARAALASGDEIVPRDSCARTALRAAGLFCYGQRHEFEADLRTITEAKDFGPVGHLIAASIFQFSRFANHEKMAQAFAQHGLTKLDASNFTDEMKPLIAPTKLAGKTCNHLAEVLSRLSEDDAKAFCEVLPDDCGKLCASAADWLRQNKDRPVELVMPVVLEQLWTTGLKGVVETRLRTFEAVEQPTESVANPQ